MNIVYQRKPRDASAAGHGMGTVCRSGRGEKAYVAKKISQKFENRSCNAKIAVLQYARSITFPKASGKAGYIGKLPCGGFSKDCELEKTNRLRRAGGNIISIGTVPPDFRRHCFLRFREKQNVQTFL